MSDRPITIAEIQKAVCDRFGLRMLDMKAHRRNRVLARPRQIAMYLASELTPRSLPEIGRLFDRDHTTVLHACRRIPALAEFDRELARAVADLRDALTASPEADPNQMLLPLAAE